VAGPYAQVGRDPEKMFSLDLFVCEDVLVNTIYAENQRVLAELLDSTGDDAGARALRARASRTVESLLSKCYDAARLPSRSLGRVLRGRVRYRAARGRPRRGLAARRTAQPRRPRRLLRGGGADRGADRGETRAPAGGNAAGLSRLRKKDGGVVSSVGEDRARISTAFARSRTSSALSEGAEANLADSRRRTALVGSFADLTIATGSIHIVPQSIRDYDL